MPKPKLKLTLRVTTVDNVLLTSRELVVAPDNQDPLELLDLQDREVYPDLLESRETEANPAELERLELREIQVSEDPLDPLEMLETVELQVSPDVTVLTVSPEHLELTDVTELRDPRVTPVRTV